MLSHKLRRYKAAPPAPSTDANFKQTVLLLHGDGTNGAQNNTFIDGSTNNFTITRNGNTTQGTFTPFSVGGSEWSNYFNGSTDSLTIPTAATSLSAADFTIEAWVYLNSLAASAICGALSLTYFDGFEFTINANGTVLFQAKSGNAPRIVLQTASIITANTWNHLALVKNGTVFTIYVNGVSRATITTANNWADQSTLWIGRLLGGTPIYALNGYISNFRLVKGTAVYTAAFTPPTAPLTAITNTSLLTCQSNNFKDNSSNNFTITRNGDVSVQPFSPFAPTSAYSTSTNGGGMYSSGGSNYLTVASNSALAFGTGDYTIETWIYYNVKPTAFTAILNGQTTNSISFYFDGGTYASNALIISNRASNQLQYSWTPLTKTWYHLAVTRSGTSLKLFINGAQVASTTNSTNYSATTTYTTFYDAGVNTGGMDGYISNLRALKGTALYTADFTPPTAPLTAITNTSLLLNGTNAAIIDNTGKNVLETVADAQIDTGTKKYGTGSLEFDGTGDWLLAPNTVNNQLGTGNFTIELWVYLATGDIGSNRGLISKGTSTTGWSVSLNTTEKVVFSYTSSTITSSGAITSNVWNHIAVVREGTGSNQTKIYIGGTNDGTGTVSTDFNQTNSLYVGANRVGGDPMKGFIDDVRVTKGIARYTATFTPATAAFPDNS